MDDNDVDGFVLSVVQDPKHEDLLFLGTDVGLYFSLDRGSSWTKWKKGLPAVQIRDMKIQEQFDDLVLGTFGRSFWILDDIEPLREMSRQGKKLLNKDFKVFKPGVAYKASSRSYQGVRFIGQGDFQGQNKSRGAVFTVWKKPAKKEEAKEEHTMTKESGKKKRKAKKAAESMAKKDGAKDMKSDKMKEKKKEKKADRVTVYTIDSQGDTLRTIKRRIKEGMNRISWNPDAKGVDFPRRETPKEKSEPGGMPLLPGTYKMVFELGDHKDSTELTIALDPRIEARNYDTKAKYASMSNYNATIEKITTAYDNLKEAKKSMKLYEKIIEAQPDTVQKEYKKLNKSVVGQIDSLMNLYMLPEPEKTEYRDDSQTLLSKLFMGRRFLSTSLGAPTENGKHAIETAQEASKAVLNGINEFFVDDWSKYIQKIKSLPMDLSLIHI